jgi:hypothetical protein
MARFVNKMFQTLWNISSIFDKDDGFGSGDAGPAEDRARADVEVRLARDVHSVFQSTGVDIEFKVQAFVKKDDPENPYGYSCRAVRIDGWHAKCDIWQVKFLCVPGKYVYLDLLSHCGNYSGSRILQSVIAYAKHIGVPEIKLADSAAVSLNTCTRLFANYEDAAGFYNHSLAPIDLLATGNTMYTRVGFKEHPSVRDKNAKARDSIANRTAAHKSMAQIHPVLETVAPYIDKPIGKITMRDIALYFKHNVINANAKPNVINCRSLAIFVEFLQVLQNKGLFPYRQDLTLTLSPNENRIGGGTRRTCIRRRLRAKHASLYRRAGSSSTTRRRKHRL